MPFYTFFRPIMAQLFQRRHGDILQADHHSEGPESVRISTSQHRTIHINIAQTQHFVGNAVTTAKYNLVTFLPKFLFEQFRRYANVFFLVIGLLQQIPDVSPTGRYVTLVPFTVILGLTAVKELIEDYQRHRDDNRVNNTTAEVFCIKTQKFIQRKWEEIHVGDIVRVQNEKPFPADLVLLASSEPDGMCFIETANLDGETNLKIRNAIAATYNVFAEKIEEQSGVLNCELPNRMLYEFKGNIELTNQDRAALSEETILLRGAKLKNSAWIHGIVVYSGPETKFMMNSTKAPLKRSHMDITTNYQIVWLFFILITMSILSAIGSEVLKNNGEKHTYVDGQTSNFFFNFLTFVILYNNLIPISLLVTLEFVKFIQAKFIHWDAEMYHEATDTAALARTSNLNEELGQIKYVFSDKTGTLTQNVMVFKKASIAGYEFHVDDRESLYEAIERDDSRSESIREFLTHLSVCHSVIPQKDSDEPDDPSKIVYNSSSPDEEALIKGAAHFGYVFVDRTPTGVHIAVRGEGSVKKFAVKEVIPFTSKRKRMTVVIEETTHSRSTSAKSHKAVIKVYTKGADSIIIKRLEAGGHKAPYYEETLAHIQEFAEHGLRTLCLAVRDLSQEEYDVWQAEYSVAKSDVTENREALLERAADKIERNLKLIGATGIEDKLQDGVPKTIEDLLLAGINVWMLTGDKQETAINIGRSCLLLGQHNKMFIVESDTLDKTRDIITMSLTEIREHKKRNSHQKFELVVDGDSLAWALDHSLRNDFIELCCFCSSVICCRVSPMQKAEMVELVQKHTKEICLSIGDGANDVAMIQKANVGVGISGNEGLQAANSSDFAIAQFSYLSRLLFVHGAWFNARNSKVILYSFYKNICLYIIELWFAIYNYWTGQVLFERWTIGMYNMLMTAAPPVAIGLFDQSCNANTRMTNPSLYKASQSSQFFNLKVFWMWIFNAILHSASLYWLPMLAHGQGIVWKSGQSGDYLVLGNIVYSCVVITVCVKAALTLDAWNWICHLAIWGSIAFWFLFLTCYSYVWPMGISLAPNMAGMIELIVATPSFWLCILLVPTISLIPDILYSSLKMTITPTETDKVRIADKVRAAPVPNEGSSLLDPIRCIFSTRAPDQRVADPDLELRSSGYAFSQEESGAQERVTRSYDTTTKSAAQKRKFKRGLASTPAREMSAASRGLPGTVTI